MIMKERLEQTAIFEMQEIFDSSPQERIPKSRDQSAASPTRTFSCS